MFEANVSIRCRAQDQSLIEGILPDVCATYESKVGKSVTLKIDAANYLSAETTGGVELVAHKGKIKISNTLEARLELISAQLVPQIRTALFGRNVNRKFTD